MKTIKIIPSKSDAHRAYIAAALSGADFSRVVCEETSEDIEATKRCMSAMMDVEGAEDTMADLYCGESGSTLRFLLPVVGALGIRGVFHPEGRLAERPISPFKEELCAHGMKIDVVRASDEKINGMRDGTANIGDGTAEALISCDGKLEPGTYRLPGNVSSQFISGLLFALPLLDGDSEIYVEGKLESSPYVDMTMETLGRFGIAIDDETDMRFVVSDDDGNTRFVQSRIFRIKGNQKYSAPKKYIVEGDWSNAAFWLAIGAIGNEPIRVEGLRIGSMQGDERVLDVLDVFGVKFSVGEDRKSRIEGSNCYVDVYPSRDCMQGIVWDASETPDMVPAIALMGAFAKCETRIVNAARLRLKESDRLRTVTETLNALGIKVEEFNDGLLVHGVQSRANENGCDNANGYNDASEYNASESVRHLNSATLESYGDHRIAMMAAAASVSMAGTDNKIKLEGYVAVNKSYPAFFDIMKKLGLDSNLELL